MQPDNKKYKAYVRILKNEIVPATGCTEPASLALAAAIARDVLGEMPDKVFVKASSNIIKNTKSVVIPNTNGLSGIPAAIAAGIVAGKAHLGLEVVSDIMKQEHVMIQDFLDTHAIKVESSDSALAFDIAVTLMREQHKVDVRISGKHTNIVWIEKDGKNLFDNTASLTDIAETDSDYELLNIADIVDFADSVAISDIADIIERQIVLNTAISNEGIVNSYGANIGKMLLTDKNDVKTRAKSMAAAASDARMSGCEMPVVIISGSGNQGITTVIPIVEYARELKINHQRLVRAIALADLVTLHLKRYIGRLSAYCGVVSAGAASGAGIAYLQGGRYEEISQTIINALAIASGMICDGAKPSCAAKIAVAVEAGIMGYDICRNGQQFRPGEGIIQPTVEDTIKSVGLIGRIGMMGTDEIIIDIMLKNR